MGGRGGTPIAGGCPASIRSDRVFEMMEFTPRPSEEEGGHMWMGGRTFQRDCQKVKAHVGQRVRALQGQEKE